MRDPHRFLDMEMARAPYDLCHRLVFFPVVSNELQDGIQTKQATGNEFCHLLALCRLQGPQQENQADQELPVTATTAFRAD